MIYKLGRRSDMDALPPMQDKIRNIISEQLNILTKYYGADTYEFNLENTSNNFFFDKHIIGAAGTTLPAFVDEMLKVIS